MHARFEVASRLVVACLAVIAVACGGGSGGSAKGHEIEFTQGALKSVPLVRPADPVVPLRAVGAPVPPLPPPTSIGEDGFTAQLFKMQCRRSSEEGVDYCPPETPPRTDYGTDVGDDPYQFSMQTLVGFVYHAQMYTELVTSCEGEGLEARTVGAGDYHAASLSVDAEPTRFIFDQYDTYACRSTRVSDPAHETRMVSADPTGSYQTTLHTRYEYVAGGDPQTDFFQVDVTLDGAGAPAFLAFNFASALPLSSRLVLLVNLTNHRFAMKYYTPQQPGGPVTAPERYAVAAGQAGYDFATGLPNEGQYYVHFSDDPGVFQECVDNVTGAFGTDFSACDDAGIPGTWSATAIRDYLGLAADDATTLRIGDYLAVFGSTDDLAGPDGWSTTTDQAADRDLYWPAGLNDPVLAQ